MAIPVFFVVPQSRAATVDSSQNVSLETETVSRDSTVVDSSVTTSVSSLPFLQREPSTKEIADFQTSWKVALLAFRSKHFAEAASDVRALQPSEKLAQIYRTLFFTHASLDAGSTLAADSALEATLHWARGTVWQRELWTLRLKSFDFQSTSKTVRREFFKQAFKAPLELPARSELLYRWLAYDSTVVSSSERSDALHHLLREAPVDSRLDSVYRILVAQYSDKSSGKSSNKTSNKTSVKTKSWDEQKLLFDFEQRLGYTQKAFDRAQILLTLSPTKPQQQALELSEADLQFRKGSYTDALKSYQKYEQVYGAVPDLYLQEARAYRRMLDEPHAQQAYSKLIELYPKNSKTMDVYWMRAFSAESAGHMPEAVDTYSRLIIAAPEGSLAEKAAFRIGLTYYKDHDFTLALKSFRDLRRLNSSSKVFHSALYWEGKAQEALNDSAGALISWTELATKFPFSYYGHVAQLSLQARHAWPDSLDWSRRFPASNDLDVRTWLKNIPVHGKKFGDTIDFPWQSAYLPVATLLDLKMENLALLTLRSQPSSFFSNPSVLYTVATLCQNAGLWTEAYHFGTSLGNLVPLEDWTKAPLAVLRLFYPPAYENAVRKWATHYNVPAGFVFALMKQESGYDAQAVSRVGALGLMQMMPATGIVMAKKEGVPGFTPDDLFTPDISIHLGTAYLRDLERQHNGDLYFTLAHYNAGPDALANWMPQLTRDPIDESVEDIGYSETREYVKRVLSNYWTYQALYE